MSPLPAPNSASKRPSTRPTTRPSRRPPTKRRRRKPDPSKAWARRLERTRPGLVRFVLDGLAERYGHPAWERRLDPTSELILTILTQNSADVNAEKAYLALRLAYPRTARAGKSAAADQAAAAKASASALAPDPTDAVDAAEEAGLSDDDGLTTRPGWGGRGLEEAEEPDWAAVEVAPIDELIEVIRPGGLAPQKAPRLQAALRAIREASGGHSLEFLGERPPLEARAWLTAIDGIGPKTASVVLMFSFGMPLMPVDRHVERVSQRIGLIPAKGTAANAHDLYLALLPPDRMYEAHVNLITHGRRVCHARKPDCGACPIAPRCRFVDRKAP